MGASSSKEAACSSTSTSSSSMSSSGGDAAAAAAAVPPCAAGAAVVRAAAGSGGGDDGTSTSTSSCPVPERYRHAAVYNVYAQRIDAGPAGSSGDGGGPDPLAALRASDLLDPKNNMPLEPNQQPCPGQRRPLSTERLQSTIPKGGTQATWLYPSPQMFFNALRRKGKGDDVKEEQMESVVRAHNAMNEATWQRVLEWEALHCDTCPAPKLLKFMGRPHDLSPLARARGWLTGELPFDRHDWVVDRCGEHVRYVIDFYFYDDRAGTRDAFEVVARPALDGPGAALDRCKMSVYAYFASRGWPCPVTGTSSGRFGGGGGGAEGSSSGREAAAGVAPQP